MAATVNNTANVSTTKGVQGGYIFSAPIGTAIPTDYNTALDDAFVNLGYVTEDGFDESVETSVDQLVDFNGDPIGTASSGRTETIVLTLAEIKKDSLSEVYGHDNVTDENGMITANHKAGGYTSRIYVLELLLKDGRKWRQVVPNGKVTELGNLSLAASGIAGRQMTITASVDDNGVSVIDYIQSTETAA